MREFRGFVLSDAYAPLVFVNGRDAKSAQLFTLVHELAHLALGETGLLDSVGDVVSSMGGEKFCDKVAAEFLMPADIVVRIFEEKGNAAVALKAIHSRTRASMFASLRRLRELDLISEKEFWRLYGSHITNQPVPERRKSSDGNFHNTKGSNLGQLFTDAVYIAVKTGRLLYSDAYKLTGMRGKAFSNYFERKGYVL